MVVMRYVKCQLPVCMRACHTYGRLSFPSCPTSPFRFCSLPHFLSSSLPSSLLPPSLPLFLSPPSLPPSSLPPPPTQGDEPLNSDDDDEDSDGEGTHFDTEDNIVCQFEKVDCSPEYCGDQHPSHTVSAALCHPWILSNIKTRNIGENGVSPHVSMAWSANGQNEKAIFQPTTYGVCMTVIITSWDTRCLIHVLVLLPVCNTSLPPSTSFVPVM